jgi:hypothetical protein
MTRKPDLPCAGCDKLMWRDETSLPVGKATCHACRRAKREEAKLKAQRTPRPCVVCGEQFIPRTFRDKACSRRCSYRARPSDRTRLALLGSHRRRARFYGVSYEPIKPAEIYERDRWRCGICHKRVDKRLKYPHPKSASLDHIVPMSQGGGHVKTNVQLAHLICNSQKSAGGGGEQLFLIG